MCWACVGLCWACLGLPGPVLDCVEAVLKLSWACLRLSWRLLICLGAVLALGTFWKYLKSRKPSQANVFLKAWASKLSLSWLVLGPSWIVLT